MVYYKLYYVSLSADFKLPGGIRVHCFYGFFPGHLIQIRSSPRLMSIFYIRIANRTVSVRGASEYVFRRCEKYRCDEAPADIEVLVTKADIDFEHRRSEEAAVREKRKTLTVPEGEAEMLAVYRQISERMPFFSTVLFHGSAVSVDGQAFCFTAPSGTGKSTHVRLWRRLFGARAVVINDDKPLISADGRSVTVYGTPWDGKHRLSANTSAPLRAICLLERAQTNTIKEISPSDAYFSLMRQTYRPHDPSALAETLNVVDRIAAKVRFYRLGCNMDPEAAEVAYNGMTQMEMDTCQ